MERLSPLLWPGDKTLLGVGYLQLVIPRRGGRVLDPFCGSVGIHMHHTSPLLLGDADCLLTDLLREIQANSERLGLSFRKIADFDEGVRSLKHTTRPVRAAAFLYVNRSSHFPHVRYNREGNYNLSFYHSPVYPEEAVRALSQRLAGVTIRNEDYHWVLLRAKAGDVVLFDPPYLATGGMYTSETGYFNYVDLVKTAELLRERNARVVITLNACQEAEKYLASADKRFPLVRKGSDRLRGNPQSELVAIYDKSLQPNQT